MSTYIVRAGAYGPVKIGRADDVPARIAALQTAHHEPLVLLRIVDTAFDCEDVFHSRFGKHRIRGEWFHFDDEMLTFIPTPPSDDDRYRRAARVEEFSHLLGRALSAWTSKVIARRIRAPERTVENWRQGRTSPPGMYMVALLGDPIMGPVLRRTFRLPAPDIEAGDEHIDHGVSALDVEIARRLGASPDRISRCRGKSDEK